MPTPHLRLPPTDVRWMRAICSAPRAASCRLRTAVASHAHATAFGARGWTRCVARRLTALQILLLRREEDAEAVFVDRLHVRLVRGDHALLHGGPDGVVHE